MNELFGFDKKVQKKKARKTEFLAAVPLEPKLNQDISHSCGLTPEPAILNINQCFSWRIHSLGSDVPTQQHRPGSCVALCDNVRTAQPQLALVHYSGLKEEHRKYVCQYFLKIIDF